MSDYEEAYMNEVYPRYVDLLCAVIRLARHDAAGGHIGAETLASRRYWRHDARIFLTWLNDSNGDTMPKGNVSTQVYRCTTNEYGTLVCHFLGLRATDSTTKPKDAPDAIRKGQDVLIKASDMSELKRLWDEGA